MKYFWTYLRSFPQEYEIIFLTRFDFGDYHFQGRKKECARRVIKKTNKGRNTATLLGISPPFMQYLQGICSWPALVLPHLSKTEAMIPESRNNNFKLQFNGGFPKILRLKFYWTNFNSGSKMGYPHSVIGAIFLLAFFSTGILLFLLFYVTLLLCKNFWAPLWGILADSNYYVWQGAFRLFSRSIMCSVMAHS